MGCPAPGRCSWPPSPLQNSTAPLVRHPCYHGGYVDTLSLAPLYESPCVRAAPRPGSPASLPVEGTGNPGACVSAIRELFNFSSCSGRQDCAFNGVYQPPVQGQFYVSEGPAEPWAGGRAGSLDRVWAGGTRLPGAAHRRHPVSSPPPRPSLTSTTPSTS